MKGQWIRLSWKPPNEHKLWMSNLESWQLKQVYLESCGGKKTWETLVYVFIQLRNQDNQKVPKQPTVLVSMMKYLNLSNSTRVWTGILRIKLIGFWLRERKLDEIFLWKSSDASGLTVDSYRESRVNFSSSSLEFSII